MENRKRLVEVFTAGCPICDDTVKLVQSSVCPSCDRRVYDLREDRATKESPERAMQYGVAVVPALAVNGILLDCCRREPLTTDHLIAAGIGRP